MLVLLYCQKVVTRLRCLIIWVKLWINLNTSRVSNKKATIIYLFHGAYTFWYVCSDIFLKHLYSLKISDTALKLEIKCRYSRTPDKWQNSFPFYHDMSVCCIAKITTCRTDILQFAIKRWKYIYFFFVTFPTIFTQLHRKEKNCFLFLPPQKKGKKEKKKLWYFLRASLVFWPEWMEQTVPTIK